MWGYNNGVLCSGQSLGPVIPNRKANMDEIWPDSGQNGDIG